jgi:hypothetical protein
MNPPAIYNQRTINGPRLGGEPDSVGAYGNTPDMNRKLL